MDQETEKMIKETLRLSRENKEMITKMFKAQRRARMWSIFKLIVMFGLLFGAYYFVSPLIDNLTDSYEKLFDNLQKIQAVTNPFTF